jgi:hypothetical protein
MQKFTEINEGKTFLPDPTIIKKYASYIIPLYLNGELKCDKKFLDEYLAIMKSGERDRNKNYVCDLEVMAIKNIFSTPLNLAGYNDLLKDIDSKCPKLEKFMKKYYSKDFD